VQELDKRATAGVIVVGVVGLMGAGSGVISRGIGAREHRALAGLGGDDLAVVSGSRRRGYDDDDSSEGEE
jgi:hypothetical protein